MTPYTENLLGEGLPYTIEINTGTIFEGVVFVGMKHLNGKNMLIFETLGKKQLTINPSYHTFTLEESLSEENLNNENKGEDNGL